MVTGDWGLGIGDWAQSPIPNPQSPNNNNNIIIIIFLNKYINILLLKIYIISYKTYN